MIQSLEISDKTKTPIACITFVKGDVSMTAVAQDCSVRITDENGNLETHTGLAEFDDDNEINTDTNGDGMYRGTKKFDREQLVFMVDAVFSGAVDKIVSSLPTCIPVNEYLKNEMSIREYIHGVINTVGSILPIMYAQLTDDGMGTNDFAEFQPFEEMVEKYIADQTSVRVNNEDKFPDTRRLAESFVDYTFDEYLKG